MKTAELTGRELDSWVARALGYRFDAQHTLRDTMVGVLIQPAISREDNGEDFEPSALWAHGGPIIERARIAIYCDPYTHITGVGPWIAGFSLEACSGTHYSEHTVGGATIELEHGMSGNTPLEAAMRAFVASKFGDEVPE